MNREYISGCGLIMDLLIITDYVLVEGQFNGKTCKQNNNQKRLNMNIHLKARDQLNGYSHKLIRCRGENLKATSQLIQLRVVGR